jgi:uncharacterized membrane protein YfcA
METVFNTPSDYILTCLILLAAQTIYVLFGFGAGLIAVGSLAMLIPAIRDIVVILLLISLPAELIIVTKSWKKISWSGILFILIGVGAGIIIGTLLLKIVRPNIILIVLAVFLILSGITFALSSFKLKSACSSWINPVIGIISGVLSGLFGTGGPPLIFYFQLIGLEKSIFRGSLMAIFLVTALVRLPSYAVAGFITPERIWSAVSVLPAVFLGIWLGNRIHITISEEKFRKMVSIALVIIGLILLIC